MAGGLLGSRLVETFTSEWDLSSCQYRAVAIGTKDDFIVCASQVNHPCIGIIMNKPTSGEAARVCFGGYTKGIAGDTVTLGAFLVTTAKGFLVPPTTAGSAHVVGQAMQAVASGSVFSLIVNPHERVAI